MKGSPDWCRVVDGLCRFEKMTKRSHNILPSMTLEITDHLEPNSRKEIVMLLFRVWKRAYESGLDKNEAKRSPDA